MLAERTPPAPANDRRSDAVVALAAVLALALCVAAYWPLPGLAVFGHDEVHYYRDFRFKLVEDGRWLNYLLHDGLRGVAPGAWAMLVLAGSWAAFYLIGRRLGADRAMAALLASATLVAYPFAEQYLWPATSAPAVAVLLLLCLMARRGIAPWAIYGLGGVLLFGTLQGFYFLLPLLFLGQWARDAASAAAMRPVFLRHFGAWVGGAVLGALVMAAMVWWLSGSVGPTPAAWRQTMPIEDLAGAWRNLIHVGEALARLGTELLWVAGSGTPLVAILLAGLLVLRARVVARQWPLYLMLLAVALAFFAFSVPLAPVIKSRSLVALVVALLAFVVLATGSSGRGRLACALLLLAMSVGFHSRSADHLRQHDSETGLFLAAVRDLLPDDASTYARIVFFGSAAGDDRLAWRLNRPPLMHAIFHAAGARDYLDCRQGPMAGCEPRPPAPPVVRRPFGIGELQLHLEPGHVAVVSYHESPEPGLPP